MLQAEGRERLQLVVCHARPDEEGVQQRPETVLDGRVTRPEAEEDLRLTLMSVIFRHSVRIPIHGVCVCVRARAPRACVRAHKYTIMSESHLNASNQSTAE